MAGSEPLDLLRPWLEARLGVPLQAAAKDPIPVFASSTCDPSRPLLALRLGERAIVVAGEDYVESLRPVVSNLALEELFSVFGAYELSRVTLPHGFGVWGPSWNLVAGEASFRPVDDGRPVELTSAELPSLVEGEIFWHCDLNGAERGFGIFEDGKLAALAVARHDGDRVWEVGIDVAPNVAGRGLGRAVFSAAGRWILERGGVVFASVAPWNVPSARTMRSIGMRYAFTDMKGLPGSFRMPPQPLGSPRPGAELVNYYPDWAMNEDIRSKDG